MTTPSLFSKRRRRIILIAGCSFMALAGVLTWMSVGLTDRQPTEQTQPYVMPDTLRIGILNSPTTYFNYRGTPMGYDYELIDRFVKDQDREYNLVTASNFIDLMSLLEKGEIDIVASPVPATAEFRDKALLCGPSERSNQVLIQSKGKDMAKDVTDLIGKHITVEQDSKFHYRLENLNSELGGGIVIETIRKDTLVSEDMIDMVNRHEISMTVVDSDIAALTLSDYPRLDASLSVSLDQISEWAVAPGDTALASRIDHWIESNEATRSQLRNKYFSTAKLPAGLSRLEDSEDDSEPIEDIEIGRYGKGRVSPYDEIFRHVASETRFDWTLVAAVAYVESRFRPELVSWAGARGIMQVMPRTANALGFNPDALTHPETCIRAGVKLLETLDSSLAKRIADPDRRTDFVLAAYNAGLGHITDAIALAEKYGLDSSHWDGGVEKAALMKSHPEYYRDPVVKNGYFRARETVDFVARVRAAQKKFRSSDKG